jgi:hypothetical protein
MNDQQVATQLRLQVETTCAEAFASVLCHKLEGRCDFTLICFSLSGASDVERFASVAYKTSLTRATLAGVLGDRLARWADPNPPEVELDLARHGDVPDESEMRILARQLQSHLPRHLGFALICGVMHGGQYISNGERLAVASVLADLIPALREAAAS